MPGKYVYTLDGETIPDIWAWLVAEEDPLPDDQISAMTRMRPGDRIEIGHGGAGAMFELRCLEASEMVEAPGVFESHDYVTKRWTVRLDDGRMFFATDDSIDWHLDFGAGRRGTFRFHPADQFCRLVSLAGSAQVTLGCVP